MNSFRIVCVNIKFSSQRRNDHQHGRHEVSCKPAIDNGQFRLYTLSFSDFNCLFEGYLLRRQQNLHAGMEMRMYLRLIAAVLMTASASKWFNFVFTNVEFQMKRRNAILVLNDHRYLVRNPVFLKMDYLLYLYFRGWIL